LATLTGGFDQVAEKVIEVIRILGDFAVTAGVVWGGKALASIIIYLWRIRQVRIATLAATAATKGFAATVLGMAVPGAAIFVFLAAVTAIVVALRRAQTEAETFNQTLERLAQAAVKEVRVVAELIQKTQVETTRAVEDGIKRQSKAALQLQQERIQQIRKLTDIQTESLEETSDAFQKFVAETLKASKEQVSTIEKVYNDLNESARKYERSAERQIEILRKTQAQAKAGQFQLSLELIDTKQIEAEFTKTLAELKDLRDQAIGRGDFDSARFFDATIEALGFEKREEVARRTGQQVELITKRITELRAESRRLAREGDVEGFKAARTELELVFEQRQKVLEQSVDEITRQALINTEIKKRKTLYEEEASLRRNIAEDEKKRAIEARKAAAEQRKTLLQQQLIQTELAAVFKKIVDFEAADILGVRDEDELRAVVGERIKSYQTVIELARQLGLEEQAQARLQKRFTDESSLATLKLQSLREKASADALIASRKRASAEAAQILDLSTKERVRFDAFLSLVADAQQRSRILQIDAEGLDPRELRKLVDLQKVFIQVGDQKKFDFLKTSFGGLPLAIEKSGSALFSFGKTFETAFPLTTIQTVERANAAFNTVVKAFHAADLVPTDKLRDAFRALTQLSKDSVDLKNTRITEGLGLDAAQFEKAANLQRTVSRAREELTKIIAERSGVEGDVESIFKANARLQEQTELYNSVHDKFIEEQGIQTKVLSETTSNLNILTESTANYVEQLEKVAKLLAEINKTQSVKPFPTTIPPIGRAEGGEIPGTGNYDSVHALLTPGEIVIKKTIAQRNRQDLLALNAGRARIQRYADGGMVTPGPSTSGIIRTESRGGDNIDVGGITLEVNEAQAGVMTAKTLGAMIQRGIRQGTIKLSLN
jgi:hypothetical protein